MLTENEEIKFKAKRIWEENMNLLPKPLMLTANEKSNQSHKKNKKTWKYPKRLMLNANEQNKWSHHKKKKTIYLWKVFAFGVLYCNRKLLHTTWSDDIEN